MSQLKVAVFGGTGFLGSNVCKDLIRLNIPCVSISRSINPKFNDWKMDQISWDISRNPNPKSGSDNLEKLKDVTTIVHVVGSLFDSTAYKQVVKSRMSSATGMGDVLRYSTGDMIQFLKKSDSSRGIRDIRQKYASGSHDDSMLGAYDKLNRDSCKFWLLIRIFWIFHISK